MRRHCVPHGHGVTPLEIMQAYAWKLMGLPYLWGGDDTIYGFDCSGVTQEILAAVGEDPPGDQTAQSLYDHFKSHCRFNVVQLGSLAFYGSTLQRVSHVGFLISDVCMVEAGGGDHTTTALEIAASQNAFVKPRPYKRRKDLLVVLRPRYTFEV